MSRSKYSNEFKLAVVESVRAELGDEPLTANKLVALAADPNSEGHAIHDWFEWDNDVAGHAHRLEQARAFLASIHLPPPKVIEGDSMKLDLKPAYVSEGGPKSEGYVPTTTPAGEKLLLAQFRDTVAAYRRKRVGTLLTDRGKTLVAQLVAHLNRQIDGY